MADTRICQYVLSLGGFVLVSALVRLMGFSSRCFIAKQSFYPLYTTVASLWSPVFEYGNELSYGNTAEEFPAPFASAAEIHDRLQ